jgi:hypothetical protein
VRERAHFGQHTFQRNNAAKRTLHSFEIGEGLPTFSDPSKSFEAPRMIKPGLSF